MELLEILQKTRKIFINEKEGFRGAYSLCCNAGDVIRKSKGSRLDEEKFRDYIHKTKVDGIFYSYGGKIKDPSDPDALYHWPPSDYDSRLKWLDEHIKLNTK
jgi:hypothetical protein